MKIIDIHSHLHDVAYDRDREEIIEEMRTRDVYSITVGTDYEESQKAVLLSEKCDHLYATVGMHPVDNREEVFDEEKYRALAGHKKVVAIGECGLDYFRLTEEKEKGIIENMDREVDRQQELFEKQITLAVSLHKPLMLHGRPSKGSMNAYEDMLYILERAQEKYGKEKDGREKVCGNFHFFVGDVTIAKRVLAIGFTMSFSGVITFAKEYEEVLREIPLTMIHAETDSPYATPIPHRGKRNSPLYVIEIIKKIAEIKHMDEDKVRTQLIENAKRIFDFLL